MMFSSKADKGLSARQVKALRARIEADRCANRPGIRHNWVPDGEFDTMAGAALTFYVCSKCGHSTTGVN